MAERTTRRAMLGGGIGASIIGRAAHAQDQAAVRTLRVVAPWDVRGIDPARGGFVFQRLSVAQTLVTSTLEGRLIPMLAQSWAVSSEGTDWRFRVGPGRSFHDGSPLTAEAVARALRLAAAATGNSLAVLPISAITADGEAVRVQLAKPFATLPAYLASYSAIILAPDSYAADGRVKQIIGTGPYRLTRLDGTLVVETEAVPSPNESSPTIRRVQYRAVADGETRARLVESGDAEIALNLQPVAADRLRRAGRFQVAAVPIPRARFIALNVGLPLFADLRVRQALSFAIDRAAAARALLRNQTAAADRLLPPFLVEWHDPATAPLRTDPAEAERLLDAAGWQTGADGIRMRDGARLSFELFTYAARPELPPLAEALVAQWRDVGIETRIRLGDSEEIPRLRHDGKLEAALVARSYSLVPDPIGTLAEDFLPPASSGYASIGWRSAALEAAVDSYRTNANPASQSAARYRITDILQAELPVIPHSWYDQIIAFSHQIAGGIVDPFEATYGIERLRWAAS